MGVALGAVVGACSWIPAGRQKAFRHVLWMAASSKVALEAQPETEARAPPRHSRLVRPPVQEHKASHGGTRHSLTPVRMSVESVRHSKAALLWDATC